MSALKIIMGICLFVGYAQAQERIVSDPEEVTTEKDITERTGAQVGISGQQRQEQLEQEQDKLQPESGIDLSKEPEKQNIVDISKYESSSLYQAASKGIEVLSSAAQDVQKIWDAAVEQLRKIAEFLRTTFIAVEKRLPPETRTRFNALADSQVSFLEDGEKLKNLAPTLTGARALSGFIGDIEANRPTANTGAYRDFMRGWELYARTFDNFVTAVDADNSDELEAFDAAKSALIQTLNVLNKLNIPMKKQGAINSFPITDALFKGVKFEDVLKTVQDLKSGEKLFK